MTEKLEVSPESSMWWLLYILYIAGVLPVCNTSSVEETQQNYICHKVV